MSLAFCDKIEALSFHKCGTKTQTRLVLEIRKVAATVGIEVRRALTSGLHTYTGCDTVSVFVGIGATGALKLLTSNGLVYREDVWRRTHKCQPLLAEDGRWQENRKLVSGALDGRPASAHCCPGYTAL